MRFPTLVGTSCTSQERSESFMYIRTNTNNRETSQQQGTTNWAAYLTVNK